MDPNQLYIENLKMNENIYKYPESIEQQKENSRKYL